MKFNKKAIKVKDLYAGYEKNNQAFIKNEKSGLAKDDKGIKGYHGKLDIRPPYQRNLVYDSSLMEEVIKTILEGYPLSNMYWIDNEDDTYELLDGQQRTLSICQFKKGIIALTGWNDGKNSVYRNLTKKEKKTIDNYKLEVYFCKGDSTEKAKLFRRVNTFGEKLRGQEIRNAVFNGPWVVDARNYFSYVTCPADVDAKKYMKGDYLRQGFLEQAIIWHKNPNETIDDYMQKHQWDDNALGLWYHFQEVVSWIKKTFPVERSFMDSVPWGDLYRNHKNDKLSSNKLESEIQNMLINESELQKPQGIYTYVLDHNKNFSVLMPRAFSDAIKIKKHAEQNGCCSECNKHEKNYRKMHADHIDPHSKGGLTIESNCQILCGKCNRRKYNN